MRVLRQHATSCFAATLVAALLVMTIAAPARATVFGAAFAKGGLSSSDLRGDTYVETRRLIAGTGGAGIQLWLWPNISLQTEALYVSKGTVLPDKEATDIGGNPIGTVKTSILSNWIEVPVLLRYEVPVASGLQPHAFIGPAFAFATSEEQRLTGAIEQTQDLGLFDSFDFVVTIGGGFEAGSGVHRLLFDLRYDLGLTKHNASGTSVQTDAVLLMVGYAFRPTP